jgi:DNA-binding response OmpR family regulator/signal transduction histidine kinase
VLVVERIERYGSLLPDQQQLLEAFAGQLASALERARLTDIAHAAHLTAERAAMRNTLLASISHDLRTPLSAIAGAGSIVAQYDFALDIYRRVTLGRLIEDKARDMSELLSNVLELVRLESGADVLNRDWHTLTDLIGMAIRRQEARLTGWRVITDVPEDMPMLSVDATLFVQLLANLLENASKYTPPGTRITISAAAHGGIVRLTVEDNGPGWATDRPERLFEKFARGQPESAAGGIGLGLAICKAVARLHAGEIRAAEARGGGARVEIEIPIPDSTCRRSMTVGMHLALIVEDDRAVQKVLRMLFESNGFRVLLADSCMRGVRDAQSHHPDILIVDLGLPDQDGIHLIKAIRTWSPAPILVLSARTAETQRLAAFDAGADDYILKPFSAPELLARVRAALRRHARGELPTGVLEFDSLSIDLSRRVVQQRGGGEVRLTPLEHRILETLARNGDRVVTHTQLMKEVWGPNRADTRSLRVFITTLRKKLEIDPSRPSRIVTEPGVGYRLVMDSAPTWSSDNSERD